jgi:hypothetical protein
VIEIHQTKNSNSQDNIFRLRIEKNIDKSKLQLNKVYNEKKSYMETKTIKNFYANDGFYLFNVFKKFFLHHYPNHNLYEYDFDLPIGEYGSKLLQKVN